MKKVKKNQYGRVSKFVLPNVSFNVGTDQPRFPGTGRRRNSYDSALRLFYKKTSLSKFRRVQPIRFVRVRPILNDKSYNRVSKTSALRRRKSLFNKGSLLNMYFSRS